MSEIEASERFIAWAISQGYTDVKVVYGKKKDQVWAKTTEKTGYPNVKNIRVGLRHHIKDVPHEDYTNILMSLEDRDKWKKEHPINGEL